MTQEVSLTQAHCITIWELKGRATRPSSQCKGQMAFYKELSDRQPTSSAGQWPAPWATTTVILALSEPKPNVSSLSLAPNPRLCILFPCYLLSLRDKREGACRWLKSTIFPDHHKAQIYSLKKKSSRGYSHRNSLCEPNFISTPLSCLKKSPHYRLTRCLRFFNDPVHSTLSSTFCTFTPGSSLPAKPSSGQAKAISLQGQLVLCFLHETLANCFSPK